MHFSVHGQQQAAVVELDEPVRAAACPPAEEAPAEGNVQRRRELLHGPPVIPGYRDGEGHPPFERIHPGPSVHRILHDVLACVDLHDRAVVQLQVVVSNVRACMPRASAVLASAIVDDPGAGRGDEELGFAPSGAEIDLLAGPYFESGDSRARSRDGAARAGRDARGRVMTRLDVAGATDTRVHELGVDAAAHARPAEGVGAGALVGAVPRAALANAHEPRIRAAARLEHVAVHVEEPPRVRRIEARRRRVTDARVREVHVARIRPIAPPVEAARAGATGVLPLVHDRHPVRPAVPL